MRKTKHPAQRKNIVISMTVAVVLLVASYFLNNSNNQLLWSEKQKTYYQFQKIRGARNEDNSIFDNAVFVDVSNAITVIEKPSVEGTHREVITNREVLLAFLRKIEKFGYGFLFLDIRFEEGDTTPCDSALVEQLLKMSKKSDVAIARRYDTDKGHQVSLLDNRLEPIAFYVNYNTTSYDQRFSKYDYIQHGQNSIALEMYCHADNEKKTIEKRGCLYFDGWRLSNNSKALAFHLRNGENVPPRYSIEKLLEENSYEFKLLSEQIGGKQIIVCDLGQRDKFGTYLGEQPGAVINWIAYKTLMDGKHKINPWCVLLMFAIYSFITLCILQKVTFTTFIYWTCRKCQKIRIAKHVQSLINISVVQFLCSFVGYAMLLLFMSLLLYMWWDMLYFPLLPTFVFSLFSNGVQFNNNTKK